MNLGEFILILIRYLAWFWLSVKVNLETFNLHLHTGSCGEGPLITKCYNEKSDVKYPC